MLTLRNAHLHAQVLPAIGGALARFDAIMDGALHPVFRPLALPDNSPPPTPSQLSCFPLVPWSNRIGGAGFDFDGRRIALSPNRAGEPCPIHGEGWQQSWEVRQHAEDSVLLTLDRQGGDPFSYLAQLAYTLHQTSLEVVLAVRNCGTGAMPFGLGLHPWFERTDGVTLHAPADTVWQRGDDGLPTARMVIPEAWNFSRARTLPDDAIDNVFEAWDGKAEIHWPETGIGLTVEANARYYIVYTRPGADFFCFEPVDHAINAHNLPGGAVHNGLTVLAPNQELTRRFVFTVST
ncbi:MAG: aldose 1-epimerase [Massilia sp.]